MYIKSPFELREDDSAALHELSGLSDEDVPAPLGGDEKTGCCGRTQLCLLAAGQSNALALRMLVFLCAVMAYTCLTHAAQGTRPFYQFYLVFIGVSVVPLAVCALFRALWLSVFGRKIINPAATIMLQVLDPDIAFLVGAVLSSILWASVTTFEPDPHGYRWTVIYGTFHSTESDRQTIMITLAILIIWGVRNVLTNFVMFYFVLGLLRNMNKSVVKFLRGYALLRKLNANWLRLSPVVSEMLCANGGGRGGGIPFSRQSSALTREIIDERPSTELRNPNHPTPSTRARVVAPVAAATAGRADQQWAPQQQPVRRSVLEQLQNKMTDRTGQKYVAEESGKLVPRYLRQSAIQRTTLAGMPNLLAVEWIRTTPMHLYVRGERIDVSSRKIAKYVGMRLFEELLEFQNLMTGHPARRSLEPETLEETDRHVREAILQSLAAGTEAETPAPAAADDLRSPPPESPRPPPRLFQREAQQTALPMVDNGLVNLWMPDASSQQTKAVLTKPMIELLMGEEWGEFLSAADLSGRGLVTRRDFVRLVVDAYDNRKQLLALIDSQDGIRRVFRRMTQGFLTFLSAVGLLFATGIPSSTVILSGVAALSSITVALSFLYSNFVQSVLFVCFLNPYNVGDRVRFGADFTEAATVHGKPVRKDFSFIGPPRFVPPLSPSGRTLCCTICGSSMSPAVGTLCGTQPFDLTLTRLNLKSRRFAKPCTTLSIPITTTCTAVASSFGMTL